jgi:hypothetical protein
MDASSDRLRCSHLFPAKCGSEEAINPKQLTGEVMLRKSVMLTCVLVLGCSAASTAKPLDSPGTVYIDGLPCSRLCLSYLAWSRHMSSTPAGGRRLAMVRPGTGIRGEGLKAAARARVAKATQVTPNSSQVRRARIAGLHPAGHAAAAQAAEAKPVAPRSNETPRAKVADPRPAASAAPASDQTATDIADPHPKAVSAAGSNARTIQEQVAAATAAAMQVTASAIPAREQNARNTDGSDHPETVPPTDAHTAAAASANDTDLLVVLVMAGPEIRSVSDLASKIIAIDDAQSASNDNVRAAIIAAGATEVELSDGQTKAIDRLISGTVPAAVLAVVSPEAALRFPEFEGFKIFQVLLLPRSLKAAADAPVAK